MASYKGWVLDAVSKLDYITVHCYLPGSTTPTNYVRFDYRYEDVRNYEGAYTQAQRQIDVIEGVIEKR